MACAIVALAYAVPSASAAGGCAYASVASEAGRMAKVDRAVLCLVNAQRARHGLRPLKLNRRLRRAAVRHSRDMVRQRYFSHRSPSGSDMVTRARQADYIPRRSSWSLAENIAWGGGSLSTARATVRSWMNSPPHRANILSPSMRDAGPGAVARTPSGGPGGTFTFVFGRRG